MDENSKALLEALQANDAERVASLAVKVLLTANREINAVEVDRFEALAPCHVVAPKGGLRGIITYRGFFYYFG